jgi:hypothetical protein
MRLHQMVPGMPAIDLFADAPVGNPKASAYLLAAYAEWFAAEPSFVPLACRIPSRSRRPLSRLGCASDRNLRGERAKILVGVAPKV